MLSPNGEEHTERSRRRTVKLSYKACPFLLDFDSGKEPTCQCMS